MVGLNEWSGNEELSGDGGQNQRTGSAGDLEQPLAVLVVVISAFGKLA